MSWVETAIKIGEDAFRECGDHKEMALEYIHESVEEHAKIYTAQACEILTQARLIARDAYFMAHKFLVDTKSDRIKRGETISDVIIRLAYFVVYAKALEHYKLLNEEIKNVD